MGKISVNDVIEALPSLTKKQRHQIKLRLQFLDKKDDEGEADAVGDESDDFSLFYSMVSNRLSELGYFKLPPLPQLKTLSPKVYKSALDGWLVVEDFVERNFIHEPLTKRDRLRLLNLFAEILVWNVGRLGEVNVSSVLHGVRRIPSTVHMQFPGYAEAGCMSMILTMGRPTGNMED